MDKFTHIKVPILNNEYFVLVAWGEQKKAIPWLTKTTGWDDITKKLLSTARGHYWESKLWHCLPIIYVNVPIKGMEFQATLAHEAIHAVECIWKHIGEDSHYEVYTHSCAAILRAVNKEIDKKKAA